MEILVVIVCCVAILVTPFILDAHARSLDDKRWAYKMNALDRMWDDDTREFRSYLNDDLAAYKRHEQELGKMRKEGEDNVW